ncbi:type IV pilus assembly protein PilX [Halopseudomonas xinjiangensis]|uniref:Type IV pilus assembly protein PilX n=1 Tax=Halopseudomonas xinjiangensis TaxID=487184 RepID=A0A1H1LRQ1_9GAMM|nr:PilX N-terminal domain-containing pilus assembly protein [Halopseudomonas xinjiangensis]SDR77216.1 type IV pilus assembly protein PilX [Halopseudomonas xinjiangensis]
MNARDFRRNQSGVSLVVALVFLLILTMLAVTNMREVSLETRITGNLVDEKRLFNSAEAGLKDGEFRTIGTLRKIPGEYSIEAALVPLDAVQTCASLAAKQPCLLKRDPTFEQDFASLQNYSPDDVSTLEDDVDWYALPAPSGASRGESENPEYGNMTQGIGIFRYEINSRAISDTGGDTRLRSTVSRVYN